MVCKALRLFIFSKSGEDEMQFEGGAFDNSGLTEAS